jgi:propanol-preferring alcohol dehydrogenase
VFTGAAGGVGHFGIQIAAIMGLRVIAIDSGASKRALCKKLGCDIFIDFKIQKNIEEEVKKITDGKGAHAVFVTAGSAQSYQSAPKMLRTGGKILCIGHRE